MVAETKECLMSFISGIGRGAAVINLLKKEKHIIILISQNAIRAPLMICLRVLKLENDRLEVAVVSHLGLIRFQAQGEIVSLALLVLALKSSKIINLFSKSLLKRFFVFH